MCDKPYILEQRPKLDGGRRPESRAATCRRCRMWPEARDFGRCQIHLLKTKNGDPRTIPLNLIALVAFGELRGEAKKPGMVLVYASPRESETLRGSRGWFPSALEEAKIEGVELRLQPSYLCQ